MKVVLSGGGTGGHIYPALTIAGALRRLDPDCEITFVGTQKGLEKDIIPRYGYPLKFIQVAGFERHLGLGTLKSACELVLGMKEAYSLLDQLDPDLVIGTGGYVCGPILFWAAMKRVPTCIQDRSMPGSPTRLCSGSWDEVFLGYKEGGRYFASHAKKSLYREPGPSGDPGSQAGRRPGKIRAGSGKDDPIGLWGQPGSPDHQPGYGDGGTEAGGESSDPDPPCHRDRRL